MTVQSNGNNHHVNGSIDPARYLKSYNGNGEDARKQTALIILNSPITGYEYFRPLYDHAGFRICADGGAGRLAELLESHHNGLEWREALQSARPDVIHGDLDSLDSEVRARYEALGVEISRDPDQYSTDFGKAVKKVIERLPEVRNILVLGSIGGRVDQGIGLLGEFYREQIKQHPGVRFWLFSEASISTILKAGTTFIKTPLKDGRIKRNIGILPLYGPAVISTAGLEWDVQDWATEMGGQMSTSNHIVDDCITVATDREVLFTVERAVGK
jgi:thiamine pyrophosphokinase